MRALLSVMAILLVLATAVAPHVHGGELGRHACVACVIASGCEPASAETPDVAPLDVTADEVALEPGVSPVSGRPLGAVPGQSPPALV